ncbi:hypothetical protein [Kitasatospora sp. NPDC127116]|uniref:hypothetical protein n=1 Tax=Kitasatospora sp. NPDC127116 TaxID=3345367 RepID=UPI0036250627
MAGESRHENPAEQHARQVIDHLHEGEELLNMALNRCGGARLGVEAMLFTEERRLSRSGRTAVVRPEHPGGGARVRRPCAPATTCARGRRLRCSAVSQVWRARQGGGCASRGRYRLRTIALAMV